VHRHRHLARLRDDVELASLPLWYERQFEEDICMTSTKSHASPEGPPVAQFITRCSPRSPARCRSTSTATASPASRSPSSASRSATSRKPGKSLADCSPESFAGALLTAAALGLEPGVNQEAYLVPYKGECTLIVGYQGYAKLFWQHPLAKHLDAHAVHENDEFDYAYGLAQYLRHKPARGDRGKITDYYAVAELSTGASAFVVLTADEVKALRGGKVGPSGKIPDPMHWMERKTALRQLVKLLPKSTNLVAALAVDEQRGGAARRATSSRLHDDPAPAKSETPSIARGQLAPVPAALGAPHHLG
jgi:phage RecT family recombinase